MMVADANPSSSDGLRCANASSLRFSPDAIDQVGVLVVQHICRPVGRDQHIGELLEDVPYLIAVLVPRHLLQAECDPSALLGRSGYQPSWQLRRQPRSSR